jgi:hypothetical protein
MGRPKRSNPLVPIVRAYVQANYPALAEARLTMRRLDGPPAAPSYAASLEVCDTIKCPFHVSPADARAGRCAVPSCTLRTTLRLLLDGKGNVLEEITSHTHWG